VLGRDTSGSGVVQELPLAVDAFGNFLLGTTTNPASSRLGIQVGGLGSDVGVAIKALSTGNWAAGFYNASGANIGSLILNAAGITLNSSADLVFNNGAMTLDSAGALKFNSGYGSAATAYGCRAWVNFNGSGTIAIRGSGNVSSITDRGVGQYTVNLTTALSSSNYSASVSAGSSVAAYYGTLAVGSMPFELIGFDGARYDSVSCSCALFL
jgi:hypothetical protein